MSDFTLSTRITADITGFREQMQQAAAATKLFDREVKQTSSSAGKSMGQQVPASMDKATRAAQKFGTETRRSMREAEQATEALASRGGRNMSAFGSMLGRFAGGFTLTALVTQIGKVGVGFHDFVSKNELAFETMLGSAEAAKSYMADILAFAKQTPFAFPELTSSAQKMIAFGVDSQKVIGILRTLGDAAVGAGGGIAELEGLSTVIGQIQAKGRLQNEEILQLAERGLPALRVLANQAEMTTAEYQKAVTAGLVDSDTAIDSLITGLREGTDGVNGMTAAYGGLMEKMKESGGISATWDSVKSSFRNMSAAITESLLPSIIALMNTGMDLMRVLTMIFEFLNGFPEPLKTAALAFIALNVAQKAFGRDLTTGAVAGTGRFIASLRAMYLEQVKNAGGMVFNGRGAHAADNFGKVTATAGQRARAGFGMITAGARGAGSALLGLFGGPAGLAITGGIALLATGISQHSQAIGEAKSFVEEYSRALTEAEGVTGEATRKILEERARIERRGTGELWGSSTLLEDADKLGITLQEIENAINDGPERLEAFIESIERMDSAQANVGGGLTKGASRLIEDLRNWQRELEKQAQAEQILEKQEKERPKTVQELAQAYRDAQYALNGFNEETEKAINQYAQGFDNAFNSAFSTVSGFKAVTVTADEYANAQKRLADANKKVAEAQAAQNRLGDLRTTSKQRADAAKAVTEAVAAQGEAYRELNNLRAKDRPVGDQMRDYYAQTLKDAEQFSKDITKLIEKGLDPKLIEDLVKKGPENAAAEMKAFLSTNGDALIELANQTEETLNGLNQRVVENARLSAIAMNSQVSSVAEDLPLAMKMAATRGDNEMMTAEQLALMLGVTTDDVKRVAASFGQEWVKTVDENVEASLQGKPWVLDPPWKVKDGNEPGNFVELEANGSVIRPEILIDPTYKLISSPQEYLDSLGWGGMMGGMTGGAFGGYASKGFWTGGVLPGFTPGRDVHQFYSPTGGILNLSGGEPIMRPEFGAAVGHDWIHRMNQIARTGGIAGVRNALFKSLGTQQSFAGGGVFGSPSVVEVPVTSRTEHHGTTIIEKVIANDPLEFQREIRDQKKRRNQFG